MYSVFSGRQPRFSCATAPHPDISRRFIAFPRGIGYSSRPHARAGYVSSRQNRVSPPHFQVQPGDAKTNGAPAILLLFSLVLLTLFSPPSPSSSSSGSLKCGAAFVRASPSVVELFSGAGNLAPLPTRQRPPRRGRRGQPQNFGAASLLRRSMHLSASVRE